MRFMKIYTNFALTYNIRQRYSLYIKWKSYEIYYICW